MANLYVTVFDGAGVTAAGDPIQRMVVNISGTSTPSGPLQSASARRRRVCRVLAEVSCFVNWGEGTPTVTDGTDGIPLEAGVAEYFSMENGHRIAVIERV